MRCPSFPHNAMFRMTSCVVVAFVGKRTTNAYFHVCVCKGYALCVVISKDDELSVWAKASMYRLARRGAKLH